MDRHSRAPRVSAALLCDQREILRETIGAGALERALSAVPEPYASELRAMTPVGWVSGEAAEAMFVHAAEAAGRDVLALHRDVVRLGVERTYRSVWRLILRLTTDSALVSRTPLLYAKTYDRGSLTSRIVSPGRAEIALIGLPDAPEIHLRGLVYGIETALTVAGRRGVRVHFERRPDGALFVASWRP
jgi:hypothetical protein